MGARAMEEKKNVKNYVCCDWLAGRRARTVIFKKRRLVSARVTRGLRTCSLYSEVRWVAVQRYVKEEKN